MLSRDDDQALTIPEGGEDNNSWLPFNLNGFVSDKKKADRLGVAGVMIEAFNIIQDRIARARLAGDPPDYTIRPKLHGIGLADFHKADEAIRIGYAETKARLAELNDQGQFETA